MINTVAFPKLFDKVFELSRVAVRVFSMEIMWYGVIITLGIILAMLYVMKRSREFGTNADQMADILIWSIPAGVIGARIYYVVNSWDTYRGHLSDVFKVWEGGLAIYGGIIVGFLAAFIFCRVKKLSFASIADLGALGFLIGQTIGRWGNFVNAEVYGVATDLPWGMSINGSALVHPAFLYESVWNLIGFVFLHFYSKRRKFKGEIALLYLGWYGLGRAWIEGIRADTLFLGSTGIKVSQALSILLVVASAASMIYMYTIKKNKPIEAEAMAEAEVAAVIEEEEQHDVD